MNPYLLLEIAAGTTRYDIVLKNYNGAAASEVARFTSTGGFNTTTSIAGGTTVGIDPDAGGTVTVGGTGGVTTTNGPITAVGVTGAVSAQTTVTGGTGVVATTGGVLASAGGVTATLGDITAAAGNIGATAGSVSAGTTVTGGTGVIATTGNVAATAGAVTAGTSVSATTNVAAGTTIEAGTTVTGGTGLIALTGDCEVTQGNVSVGGDGTGTNGNVSARVGYSSQIAGQIYGTAIANNANLALVSGNAYGAVSELQGDTYVLGPYGGVPEEIPAAGATSTFLCLNATVAVAIDGADVTLVAGGGSSSTGGFTCPQFESFTIYCIDPSRFFVFGNVTML